MKITPNTQIWLDALRSGEYVQGFEALRTGGVQEKGSFCCLGVATDKFFEASPERGMWVDAGAPMIDDEVVGKGDLMPMEVARWLGLPESILYTSHSVDEGTCSIKIPIRFLLFDEVQTHNDLNYKRVDILNDSSVSFSRLADLIEQTLLALPEDAK